MRIILAAAVAVLVGCSGAIESPDVEPSVDAGTDAAACVPIVGECLNAAGAPLSEGTPCSCGECYIGKCEAH